MFPFSLTKNNSFKQFFSGTSAAFLIIIAGKGLFYVMQLVLARLLGVEGYGIYTYVLTVISMLAIFTTMGFDSSLIKYCAMYRSQERWSLFTGFLRRSVQIPFIVSVIASLIGLFLVSSIYQIASNRELYHTFIAGWILLPFLTILIIIQSIFRSQKNIILSLLPSEIVVPFFLIAGVVSAYWLSGPALLNSINVFVLHVCIVFCVLVVFAGICFKKILQLPGIMVSASYNLKEWIFTSGAMLLVTGSHVVLSRSDILLLGMLKGTAASGVYIVAVKISVLVSFGLQVGNQIIAPMISEFFHDRNNHKLQEVVRLGTLSSTLFAILIILIITIGGEDILLWFGKEFLVAKYSLYVLMAGNLANAIVGPVGLLMNMTGHHRQASIISLVSAIVNIILNLIFIPLYGVLGAAIATTITMVGWNSVMWLYVLNTIKINTFFLSFSVKK